MENELDRLVDALPGLVWTAGLDGTVKARAGRDRMMPGTTLIAVVDDDRSVRESLPELLRECGYAVEVFSSAQQLLASDCIDQTHCFVLDIAMPGMSGPELQRELKQRGHQAPVIFITAQSDHSLRPRLLAEGAVECLFKPFSENDLLGALQAAVPMRQARPPHEPR